MFRSRSLAFGALLVCAVACGDESGGSGPASGGSAGSSVGAGATGGVGSNTGGTGAVDPGSGGVGGGSGGDGGFVDPAYTCPSEGGAPASAVVHGAAPALAIATTIGGADTDLLTSSVALPDGGAALLVFASSSDGARSTDTSEETCILYRASIAGEVTELASWPHEAGSGALVASDAQGNLVVAGVAHAPFAAGSAQVAPRVQGDGFVYLLDVRSDGEVSAGETFPFMGDLSLTALVEAPDGGLAFAGSLTGRLDVGGESIEPPAFDGGPLAAAFVARLSARRTLGWQRVFHATGTPNDPQALEGTGGTDGLGHSAVTDLALAADDSLVVGTVFTGGIDLEDARLPNDGTTDGLVVKLYQDGSFAWARHIYGVLGVKYVQVIGPEGSGGVSGNAPPDGVVRDLRVAVDPDGRVAVTAGAMGHALLDGVDLDGGMGGHLTALFDAEGALIDALPDGGADVAFTSAGDVAAWDGSALFALALDGRAAWSLTPGGQLLPAKPSLLENGPQGLWVTGSFIGGVDLGAGPLSSNGCADAFAARFIP